MKKKQRVLVLGSGALKIGEAGEFDYSGSQAIQALKEEGFEVWLVNPNIATIQTTPDLADRIFLLPVDPRFVAKILARGRLDGILLSFGGQTALNCGLALHRSGALKRNGVKVLGTPVDSIRRTEDRALFRKEILAAGLKVPWSLPVRNLREARAAARRIGYPVRTRTAFSLGGFGSGLAHDEKELARLISAGLSSSPQAVVEEDLSGWKEIEYEVVRDSSDNCIAVCNMENLDPMGIHTGESIVVAPSQTLTNREYFRLRDIAFQVIRRFRIVGECNIQYALDPDSSDYRIIEVNARLSRSSALASKATGYPLARIAAKLAVGYSLPELKNSMNDATTACFEPALDYLVVKIPKWDLAKFDRALPVLGSEMKSIGEVMAIGRNFEEALQKGCRMLDDGISGLVGNSLPRGVKGLGAVKPTPWRIFALAEAIGRGARLDDLSRRTGIDPWFLQRIASICKVENSLKKTAWPLRRDLLEVAKETGFSDPQIAGLVNRKAGEIRSLRDRLGVHPVVKQIDTLAAEYPVRTNYLYVTYHGRKDDLQPVSGNRKVVIPGSGPYRIGSSVEFDWCCVSAARALQRMGYDPVVVNCNPETVSTDYDSGHTLYFEELTPERIFDIWEKEMPLGILLAFGGQIPNRLAMECHRRGIRVFGTDPRDIDRAEDRKKFSALMDRLGVSQPPWIQATTVNQARRFARRVGYPVLVRPSYVLSGSAMRVAADAGQLGRFLAEAAVVSPQHPVVVSKFIVGAKELEADAVARAGSVLAMAVMEHVENAGVHSGDATVVFPPQKTYLETVRRIQEVSGRIAEALRITGPFNIQFLAVDNQVMVIECNLRTSRSFPFVSKVSGVDLVDLATRAMMGERVEPLAWSMLDLDYVGVKAPQFSYSRIKGADPVPHVEMASTGEVACLGNDLPEAFLKALLATGFHMPRRRHVLLSIGTMQDKARFLDSARLLHRLRYRIHATRNTSRFLESQGIPSVRLYKIHERRKPSLLEHIQPGKLDLIINIPRNTGRQEVSDGYVIRRQAADFGIPLVTNLQLAELLVKALSQKKWEDLLVKSWDEYVRPRPVPGLPSRIAAAPKIASAKRSATRRSIPEQFPTR
ncbi:MAG: carbamoyl-phosphate synthase (glutamine-hydrolyzing) large subunit [Acidobacteriota bacterium]